MTPVLVARCPEHGLHGERDSCFECGGEVEQVPLFSRDEVERLMARGAVKVMQARKDAQDDGRRFDAKAAEKVIAGTLDEYTKAEVRASVERDAIGGQG